MANKVILTGRLVAEAKESRSKQDKKIAQFALAVADPTKEDKNACTFIDCVAFDKVASVVISYCNKGSKILLVGKLQKNTYQAKDKTTRSKTFAIAESIELLDTKKQEPKEEESDFYEGGDDLFF